MKLILTYNRIVGNTFFGWMYHGETMSKWKIWLYRLWNIVLVAILGTMCYISYRIVLEMNKGLCKYLPDNNTPFTGKINMVKLLQLVSTKK